ncbi:MAG: hypothetical protein GY832_30100 [Chloroflexi bacterium]|nr:hypothetical protein [Chloroflexota bacterium]
MLIASLGQLRLASSGHVVGIDMRAALSIADARGFDMCVISELLSAAEAGLIEARQADNKDLSHGENQTRLLDTSFG